MSVQYSDHSIKSVINMMVCNNKSNIVNVLMYLMHKQYTITIRITAYSQPAVTICISYNTGKSALPDIYARCLRASAYISGNARVPVL